MNHSNKEARDQYASNAASKMAGALAEAWMKGERTLVMQTIQGAFNRQMREQWQEQTAAALPEAERDAFNRFMR